jgi:hypothetical protein
MMKVDASEKERGGRSPAYRSRESKSKGLPLILIDIGWFTAFDFSVGFDGLFS